MNVLLAAVHEARGIASSWNGKFKSSNRRLSNWNVHEKGNKILNMSVERSSTARSTSLQLLAHLRHVIRNITPFHRPPGRWAGNQQYKQLSLPLPLTVTWGRQDRNRITNTESVPWQSMSCPQHPVASAQGHTLTVQNLSAYYNDAYFDNLEFRSWR